MSADPACASDHCVTCADEANPLRVIEPGADGLALCTDGEGSREEVMVDLVGTVEPGDVLLVHAGVALTRVEEPAA
jgi:hydrogenase expression/formation protein HypC